MSSRVSVNINVLRRRVSTIDCATLPIDALPPCRCCSRELAAAISLCTAAAALSEGTVPDLARGGRGGGRWGRCGRCLMPPAVMAKMGIAHEVWNSSLAGASSGVEGFSGSSNTWSRTFHSVSPSCHARPAKPTPGDSVMFFSLGNLANAWSFSTSSPAPVLGRITPSTRESDAIPSLGVHISPYTNPLSTKSSRCLRKQRCTADRSSAANACSLVE
mmetsp:Transcript_11247/g.32632  ORF Transcript_11247/g.32632 Transcript_11247/m.32632 type:complete len:217 (+) Transcript_11247:1328-1978(+)